MSHYRFFFLSLCLLKSLWRFRCCDVRECKPPLLRGTRRKKPQWPSLVLHFSFLFHFLSCVGIFCTSVNSSLPMNDVYDCSSPWLHCHSFYFSILLSSAIPPLRGCFARGEGVVCDDDDASRVHFMSLWFSFFPSNRNIHHFDAHSPTQRRFALSADHLSSGKRRLSISFSTQRQCWHLYAYRHSTARFFSLHTSTSHFRRNLSSLALFFLLLLFSLQWVFIPLCRAL